MHDFHDVVGHFCMKISKNQRNNLGGCVIFFSSQMIVAYFSDYYGIYALCSEKKFCKAKLNHLLESNFFIL